MLRFTSGMFFTMRYLCTFLLIVTVGCSSGEVDQILAAKVAQSAEDAKAAFERREYDEVIELTSKCLASGLLQQQLLSEVILVRTKSLIEKGELDSAKEEISNYGSVATDPTSVHLLKYLYLTKKGDNYNAERELEQARSIDPTFSIVP